MGKNIYKELIIDELKNEGALSRAELAKHLKISKPTVSLKIEELISQGLVKELGEGRSSGGRKPMLVDINEKHKIILALDFSRLKPIVALGSFTGSLIGYKKISVDYSLEDKDVQKIFLSEIENYLLDMDVSKENLGVVMIASPGVIDEESGEIVFANPQFNVWATTNIKQYFSERFNVDTIVKNDISVAALGEFSSREIKTQNQIYISCGLGIGAGLIINGELFEGAQNAAGEIGYFRGFGKNRTETLEEAISVLSVLEKEEGKYKTFEALKEDFLLGEDSAVRIAREIADELAIGINNVVVLLNLESVIIGGLYAELGDGFSKMVNERFNEISPIKTEIRLCAFAETAGVEGSFVIGSERIMMLEV